MVAQASHDDTTAAALEGIEGEADQERGPAFDLAALGRATGGDEALQREVLEMFSGQVADKLEVIRRAVLARDAETLREASHTLLGSCSTLGAVGLAELVVSLESAAESGAFEIAERVCDKLTSETERSMAFLRQRGLL